MADGRGLHMIERKKITAQRVKDFVQENPDAIKKDVAKALGLSVLTLRTHLRELGLYE